jgi:hypothetical protein
MDATVWAVDLESGRLPNVCIKTGRPTGDRFSVRFATPPEWTALLLIGVLFGVIGLLPYAIIRSVLAVRARGRLPLSAGWIVALRLIGWGAWISAACGTAVAVTAFFLPGDAGLAGLIVGLALIVLAIVGVAVYGFVKPKAKVREAGIPPVRWVELRNVHPAFAAAVLAMYGEGYLLAGTPAV